MMLQALVFMLTACNNNNSLPDAYGNFEATEVTVSAEGNGQIQKLNVEEGQQLKKGKQVGSIDTLQLYLKKQQLLANRKSIASKTGNIVAQMDVLKTQLEAQQKERERFKKLVAEEAATPKTLDDIEDQIKVLKAQIRSLETQNEPVISEINAIDSQIKQIDDQIQKSRIVNPVKGTVLVKYAEEGEVATFGKPLYKIADLDTMTLKVYISGSQLPEVKLGEKVSAMIDNGNGGLKELYGIVSWISDEAEFTPKTIQTREERVNLVYAVKVKVPNNGSIKIGMPGEMKLPEKAGNKSPASK